MQHREGSLPDAGRHGNQVVQQSLPPHPVTEAMPRQVSDPRALGGIGAQQPGELRGVVQASLPLTRVDDRYFSAELDGPPAQASMRLAEMETFQTAGAPDSAGRIYTDTCKLAAPVEVPLGVFGGLVVDRREKAARMNILFSSLDEVTLDCVHSVSGPHKGRVTVSFSVGTHENGVLYEGLPIADPAHLVVTHAMVPGPGMTSDDIRSEQKWDLRLER